MVTFEQAQTANDFHESECHVRIGERGGRTTFIRSWRRSGKTKVWKTRSGEFQIPVKYGLYASGYITHDNANHFHISADCPLIDNHVISKEGV